MLDVSCYSVLVCPEAFDHFRVGQKNKVLTRLEASLGVAVLAWGFLLGSMNPDTSDNPRKIKRT